MKYICCPYDENYYATALNKNTTTNGLNWECARGEDSIIIQTEFGVTANDMLPRICEALNKNNRDLTECDDYMEVLSESENIECWILYVSTRDKGKNNGCKLNGVACTYTVFGCHVEGDECRIFLPSKDNRYQKNFYNVPIEIKVSIIKERRKKRCIIKRYVDTGFYSMTFSGTDIDYYLDGSLCYKTEGVLIPVTRDMIYNGTVFVQTTERPEIIPQNNGIKIKE